MDGETGATEVRSTSARTRLRIVGPPGTRGPEHRPNFFVLPLLGAWIGTLSGLLELGLRRLQGWSSLAVTQADLRLNHHFLWMVPISDLVLFGVLGLVLGLISRVRPPRFLRFAAFVLLDGAVAGPLLSIHGLSVWAVLVFATGLAVCLLPALEERRTKVRAFAGRSAPVLAVIVAALIGTDAYRVGFAEQRAHALPPRPAVDAPNVLFIVLDTVRADHLSLYDYSRPTTPFLSRLAQRGVRFDRASATAPWTLPSHASMFTGRWPHELSVSNNRRLDATDPTLAEVLSACGHATAGIVGNTYFCNARFGLDRGFAHYEDCAENERVSLRETLRSSEFGRRLDHLVSGPPLLEHGFHELSKDAATINRDALAWLARRPADRPFFLFLNYMDAHGPYRTSRGYERRYGNEHELFEAFRTAGPLDRADKRRLTSEQSEQFRHMSEVFQNAYDDCITSLDAELDRLFASLEQRGCLQNTLVVVTADHGEHLGEKLLYSHGCSLYRPVLHVPLLIVPPGPESPGRIVTEPVGLRDLPATVLDLIGAPGPSPFPGRSLTRFWREGPATGPLDPDLVLSETDLDHPEGEGNAQAWAPSLRGPMRSLARGDYRYIRNGDGREELYHIGDDPQEEHDLVSSAAARPHLEQFRADLARLPAQGRRVRNAGL